ncbi:MAG: amino acid adenylation domain-containing protein [Acidobacteriota bacterium]
MSTQLSTADLLTDLSQSGVRLWAEGDQLRFRAPRTALTVELRDELRKRKPEILEHLRRESEMAPLSGITELVPAPEQRHQPFPLTDIQQAYWIGRTKAFELGGVSAHLYMERVVEDLDLERFARAWQKLVERHEMLRTEITPDGDQRIRREVTIPEIPLHDLRGKSGPEIDRALAATREQMSEHGPDLEAWPLFEIRASRCSDNETRLHLSLSLLVCDALSSQILFRELLLLYQDPDRHLPALELSFRDWVTAQADLAASESFRRSLAYWRARLDALPQAPELPLAKSPTALDGASFTRRSGRLDPEAWRRLKTRAKQAGLTPMAVVATTYADVLGLWSKNQHFLLNVLFFNRPLLHPQINQVVGNFSTTILLEVDATRRGETFEERARRLQQQLWQDIEHAQVSGIRVLRELQRNVGGAPTAIPVVLASTLGLAKPVDAAARSESQDVNHDRLQTPQVWLDHQIGERGGALVFNWDAIDELFPEGMLEAMFEIYRTRLEQLAEGEDAWTGLGAQAPPEQLARRREINATEAPVSSEYLHTLFRHQADQHPEQPAVLCAGRTLTYGELRTRSSHLARQLRDLGAAPNQLVAMVMHKGWQQIVAALAILESGAAYLPIDAALPRERRSYLLDHGQVDIALVQPELDHADELPERVARLVVADEPPAEPVEALDTPPPQRLDDLAYVIYTSGSTGQPKGVMIDHRGAVNTVLDINRRFEVTASDRMLAISSMSFDLSVYDVFGLLAAGGAIVVPEPEALREPARWAELISEHRITLWNTVPALMEMLVDHLADGSETVLEPQRLVMMSGDWIPVRLPDRIRTLNPACQVISLGGATEASIWSILHPIDRVEPDAVSIPYGRPMVNQAFHVLNERLEDCPDWVTGQLFIEGIGVAKGYWRDEAKSRASFFDHPASGRRIYRTGDLGRYLGDGEIEILGRDDLQVKIQGYRIELPEIEAALNQHPDVRTSAVVAVGELRGNKRLVGWAVSERQDAELLTELHTFLESKVPDYMVPASLHRIAELPLNANGKVDRGALAATNETDADAPDFVAPRDELELSIAELWQDLLEQPSLGIHDNFFDRGGHSLLAVRLMTQIRQRMGRDLPLATLFEAPTIESLAKLLRREGTLPPRSALVGIQPLGDDVPPFFCVHPVGGSVLCYVDLARQLEVERPFLGLQVPDPETAASDGASLEDMAAEYLRAVRERQAHGPYHLGGWSMGGVIAYEMARQLQSQGEEVATLVLIDAARQHGDPDQIDDAVLASWFVRDLGGLTGQPLELSADRLRTLDSAGELAAVVEQARGLEVLQDVSEAEIARLLAVFRRNFQALLHYRAPAYTGSLVVLKAAATDGSATLGWSDVAGRVEAYEVPGDHYTIMQPPHVDALAEHLRGALAGSAEPERER